jgi:hypothetical protein
MRLKATFVIEVEAEDYLSAGNYQRRLESLLGDMQSEFGTVDFSLKERRASRARREQAAAAPARFVRTGNLHEYEED